jgi:peptidylprolyl isomerase
MATPLANLITGWQQGLAGQTVGSQVLLIVPPDLGYGANDNGSIPANSTLIFVVDILAAA